MNQEHPITPPPELIVKWAGSMCGYYEAARWGADQELEACCEWLCRSGHQFAETYVAYLRAARRPKLLSLKEQALEVLNEIESGKHGWLRIFDNLTTIRRALESLPD